MKNPFRFRDWVEEFRQEVEAELKRPKPQLTRTRDAATPAVEGFRAWWSTELEGAEPTDSLSTLQTNKELELSRKELKELREEVEALRGGPEDPSTLRDRVRQLVAEQTRLQERVVTIEKENAALRQFRDTIDEQHQALRLRLASVRAEAESKVKVLSEQAESAQRRAAALEAELRDTRERRLDAEKRLQEHLSVRAEIQTLRSDVQLKLESAAEFLEQKIRTVAEQGAGQMQSLQDLLQAMRRMRERDG